MALEVERCSQRLVVASFQDAQLKLRSFAIQSAHRLSRCVISWTKTVLVCLFISRIIAKMLEV
jgi:hypothetical protein